MDNPTGPLHPRISRSAGRARRHRIAVNDQEPEEGEADAPGVGKRTKDTGTDAIRLGYLVAAALQSARGREEIQAAERRLLDLIMRGRFRSARAVEVYAAAVDKAVWASLKNAHTRRLYTSYRASGLRELCARQLLDRFKTETGAKDRPPGLATFALASRTSRSRIVAVHFQAKAPAILASPQHAADERQDDKDNGDPKQHARTFGRNTGNAAKSQKRCN